jgi:hypothetical protein
MRVRSNAQNLLTLFWDHRIYEIVGAGSPRLA